jgi:transposase
MLGPRSTTGVGITTYDEELRAVPVQEAHRPGIGRVVRHPISEGTVATVTNRAADRLEGFLEEVTDRITGSEVVGFDEIGLRVAGRLHWVHCARTGKYTLITCHPKRGREGLDAAGVLERLAYSWGLSSPCSWLPPPR